ncbi:hypothetical protein BDV95DRAFT_279578 [Massariosphaeria phaeospora]|uniref:FAD-binding PCMH-type domain-containing protein n=1 Tax=Massariosphaeria phaeospora TaxID=100035 RepID=A0A7C8IBQ0_9PLEO|nr:hypothetical protein BDV95DRAFT_279578 [Massariosphaeria phaeospora]
MPTAAFLWITLLFANLYCGATTATFERRFEKGEPLSAQLYATSSAIREAGEASAEEIRAFESRLADACADVDALSTVGGDANARGRAASVCTIAAKLNIVVVAPNSPGYDSEKDIHWSLTSRLLAACFIRPQSTLDVAAVIKIAAYTKSKFAVRSGGHNPNAGFASVDETGVLIDLQDMNALSVDEDAILKAGPGNRWGKIYEFLDAKGLGAQGGRNGDVGVAGYLLGGGMSFFPNLYGLGVDTVVNFKVVLGNATVVNANATSNPDLFVALKGGANNFGIITEFQIQAHTAHQMWYSLEAYAAADYKAVLNATIYAQTEMEKDPKVGLFVNINPGALVIGKFYAEFSDKPAAFAAFDVVAPIATPVPATNGTMHGLVTAISPPGYTPANREPIAVSHGVDLDLYMAIHEQYLLVSASTTSTVSLSYTIQPFGTAGVQAGHARGGNNLGLEAVSQTWHASLVEWTSPEDNTTAHDLVTALGASVEALARQRNSFYPYRFMNDASYVQDPLQSYGLANAEKMRAVSSAYDGGRVFQILQNSGFLLAHL